MNFLLGCNYWASHAGTEMWRNWDEQIIESDLEILSQNGVSVIRIFPNWRDFQPVQAFYTANGDFYEYRTDGELLPANSFYLSDTMMNRFEMFCDIARKYNIKLIVGLITGWMSGRLFTPPALTGKNILTDAVALMFQQKFIRGFVGKFKEHGSICAWDLGNECNCMSLVQRNEEAYCWSAVITNAIRACDNTRPIISGMHSLGVEGIWRIQDQAELTDILTTHPYPVWVEYCSNDKMSSIRTLLHATAETEYYTSIGNKPCLIEEIGTMGPMICNEKMAANFMRVNLFSSWAHGAAGLMWWCAHDQNHLSTAPYDWNMCERELGMLDSNKNPKPMLMEMRKFSQLISQIDISIGKAAADGVCILTKGQQQWGVAYMSFVLAKQAGVNLTFSYCESVPAKLPDSPVYLLPSINGHLVMSKTFYDELKQKVFNGATLYISINNGFLTEFEKLTGLSIVDCELANDSGTAVVNEKMIFYERTKRYLIENKNATILATDEAGNALFSVCNYGKGKVYFINYPLEHNLMTKNEGFANENYEIYRTVFEECLSKKNITTLNTSIGITEHVVSGSLYAVVINYSNIVQNTDLLLRNGYRIFKVHYGSEFEIPPCDATIIELKTGN